MPTFSHQSEMIFAQSTTCVDAGWWTRPVNRVLPLTLTVDLWSANTKLSRNRLRGTLGSKFDGSKLPILRRIIKGRPFEVGFECEAKLYRKEHPYEH